MLRPSPVLTPPPANSSPTTFRYGSNQSPPPISPRSTAAPAIQTASPAARSASATLASSSPRLSGLAAVTSARNRSSMRSTVPMMAPSTDAVAGFSDTMVATTSSDSNHTMVTSKNSPIVADQASASAGIAAPLDQHATSAPVQQPMTTTGSSVSDASPSKRRGEDIERTSIVKTEAARDDSTQSAKRARPDEQPPKVLPVRYELCAVEDMVELIAYMLNELIATNDAIRTTSGGLTRFHSRAAPGISVRDYLHRLAKHATLIPPLLLSMVYYIDRLCALYPEFTINTLTVHRFLITAATVAAKGLSDSFWNNTTYARVGGVRLAELKMLELEFLYRVDWRIVPNPEVLVAYYRGLVERTPGYVLEGSDDDEMDEAVDGNDAE